MQIGKRKTLTILSAVLLGAAGAAHAHGNHAATQGTASKEQKAWGIAGDPEAPARTIEVAMDDSMRFEPSRIHVRLGETVRFVHRNRGRLMHEFVLGTRPEHESHAARMAGAPRMDHDEPHIAHVAPGRSAAMVWTFNRPGSFEFACLIDGHYQAGMSGMIHVSAE